MQDRDFRPRKILVATDYSEYAAAALRRAFNLAEKMGAELTVLHVREEDSLGEWIRAVGRQGDHPTPVGSEPWDGRREAEQRLSEWLALHGPADSNVPSAIRVGVPFVEIIRTVLEEKHDLVVAGTRGLSAVKRFFVGSTAERLVRKCPCPVWIVKPSPEEPLRSILVPVDLSQTSGKALRLAATLAGKYSCSLTALYVFNFPKENAPELLPNDGAGLDFSKRRRAARQAAAKQLGHFVTHHVAGATEVRETLGIGLPWQVITSAARRMNADVIVMGSVGRTELAGFFIGSTAEKVLRLCDRSILTVKPDGFVSPVTPAP